MSSEIGISARALGKRYELYDSPWRRLAAQLSGRRGGREHWALRGVDLEVGAGEALAIVGRNGAGKSTLLEIVCGILAPTEGSVAVRGRVAALLQLGAGFNPEFTGRENALLSGALYGLSDGEIRKRLPAIEAFADIGGFIDRPVREYSSGMYARLAFSICAHVDADILAIDEILGVGDVRFQQRSMRFLREFRRRGAVLFVSHDEHAVAALCDRAIWIESGRLAAEGSTKEVLNAYRRDASRLTAPGGAFRAGGAATEADGADAEAPAAFDPADLSPPDGAARIEGVAVTHAGGEPLLTAGGGEEVLIEVRCAALRPVRRPRVVFALRDPMGQVVFAGDNAAADGDAPASLEPGQRLVSSFGLRLPYLPTGSYPVEVYVLSPAGSGLACHARDDLAAVVPVLSAHISSGMANVRMLRAEIDVLAEVA